MANKKKIVLRRGPAIDLPGKPRAISPKQWNASLEEGEMAFAADESRIFVGPNPESTLKQARRLQYPYRNIEVIGEGSDQVFERMHGERMREGDNRDYYVAQLTPALAIIPTGYIDAQIIISSDIESFNGRRLKVFLTNDGQAHIYSASGRSKRLATPARYWRIRAGQNGGSSSIVPTSMLYIGELGLHETIGGPNIISQAIPASVAGGIDSNQNFLAGDDPLLAVDGNPNTQYVGRRPDFGPYPITMPMEGIAFDFGAGNEKWINEASIIWGTSVFDDTMEISMEFSDDNINWTKAYRGVSWWPIPGQLRYIPERPEPTPHKKVRHLDIFANKYEGAAKVRITEMTVHAVVDGPPLQLWTQAFGTARNVYDGNLSTEWVSFGTDTQISAQFRFTKSPVVQVKITGPVNPSEAPREINFRWGLAQTMIFEGQNYDNLTWTPLEVKTFNLNIPDNTTNTDCIQLPLTGEGS